jgi:hypothetical protein
VIALALAAGLLVGLVIGVVLTALASYRRLSQLEVAERAGRERVEDLRGQLDAAHRKQRRLARRCELYLSELDAVTMTRRPPEHELFAASVEADLAQLEVAEPEQPKYATRVWPPFKTKYETWPPFGIATRPDERREA